MEELLLHVTAVVNLKATHVAFDLLYSIVTNCFPQSTKAKAVVVSLFSPGYLKACLPLCHNFAERKWSWRLVSSRFQM